jgi:dipeptidyl aminopeptidase/acylaminoacyl peptidase
MPRVGLSGWLLVLCAQGVLAQTGRNFSIDPDHIVVPTPVANPPLSVTEPVMGSTIPAEILMVEMRDGVYAPIAVRKPAGNGPFPTVVFAHMNGGQGTQWLREWLQYGSGTLEQFLDEGYAVVWMRYRAEIDNAYGDPLVEGKRQGRQMFNRGPFEFEDAIDIIEFVRALPYVDAERIGYVGLSHGGEMLLKITSEYRGIRAGIASEPAANEFLAQRPRDPSEPPEVELPETAAAISAEEQAAAVANLRRRLDMDVAMRRIRAIQTPIFVQGRDRDHNQSTFRLSYELLEEAGKDATWKSYDHEEHGFLFVRRNAQGAYVPDGLQREVIADSLAFFAEHLQR